MLQKGTLWWPVTQDATGHGSASQTHRFQARPCGSCKLPPHPFMTGRGLHFPGNSRGPAAVKTNVPWEHEGGSVAWALTSEPNPHNGNDSHRLSSALYMCASAHTQLNWKDGSAVTRT